MIAPNSALLLSRCFGVGLLLKEVCHGLINSLDNIVVDGVPREFQLLIRCSVDTSVKELLIYDPGVRYVLKCNLANHQSSVMIIGDNGHNALSVKTATCQTFSEVCFFLWYNFAYRTLTKTKLEYTNPFIPYSDKSYLFIYLFLFFF